MSRADDPAPRRGLLMMTRADIFPANHGAAVAIDRLAWGLSRCRGPVYLVTDHRHRYFLYENGERRTLWYPRRFRLAVPRRLISRWLELRGIPRTESFLYWPAADWSPVQRALYVARTHGLRAYQAAFPAYAIPCLCCRERLGGPVVLVEHNVEYQRIADQTRGIPPRGVRLLREIELGVCEAVDGIVAVSDADRAKLLADGVPGGKVQVIPHGVDLAAYDSATPHDVRGELGIPPGAAVLVYHGIYSYAPNREAVEVLGAEILPALRSLGIDAWVVAIGRDPPPASPDPHIIFTGPVPSVAPYLLAADLAVVPLRQGGGTRMKVLDYFAARLPVVSTAKGIEGIPVRDGSEYVRADSPAEFAAAVARLLNHREEAHELARRGRAFVEPLDWLAIARRHAELLDRLGAERVGSETPAPY
jgi:glycosyltransferase involved in cell wall biosynthesis